MSNKLDERTEKLLEYALVTMSDKPSFQGLVEEVIARLREYFSESNKEHLKQKVLIKMVHGAVEHGEPPFDPEDVDLEIEQEYLDLIGWRLMKRFIATEKN